MKFRKKPVVIEATHFNYGPPSVWRDLFDPGWREREAARVAKFMAAIPVRCGCRLGTCGSKPNGCRMAEEVKPGSGAQ